MNRRILILMLAFLLFLSLLPFAQVRRKPLQPCM